MDKIGVFTQKQHLNNGLQKFESRVAPFLIDNGVEPIYHSYRDPDSLDYPFSRTVQIMQGSRKLKKKSKEFDKIFLPAHNRLTVDVDELECQVIPYVHDILPYTAYLTAENRTTKKYLVKAIQNLFGQDYMDNLVKLDKVIVASELTKKDLEQRTTFNGEIDVVYQGIDGMPEKEVAQTEERDIDLLYVGTLRERKNPDFIRKTFQKAHDKGLKVASVNYQKIDLPGKTYTNISDQELTELYNRTKFYLHPTYLEGFGRGPAEAQRYGAIPIALDNEINHEILGEKGGSWIEIESIDAVIDVIETVNPKKYRKNAVENSSRFRWSKTKKEILSSLKQ